MTATVRTTARPDLGLVAPLDDLNSLQATARFLRKSERTVQRLVEKRALVCVRVGRTPMFSREAISDYLARRVGAPSTHGPRAAANKTPKLSRHPKYGR